MKLFNYTNTLFLIIFILNCIYVVPADAFLITNDSNISSNINQNNITLFLQNYSEFDSIPKNVFIAKKTDNNCTFDRLYSTVYGTYNSNVVFDNASQGLTYTTRKNPAPSLVSLLPIAEPIFDFGMNNYNKFFREPSKMSDFYQYASIPLNHGYGQPRQSGSLYISNFVPMVKSTYQISMNMKTDSSDSFIEMISPGSRLIIQEIDNNIVLKSYYQNSKGDLSSKIISIGDTTEISKFNIIFDGDNKTNTIYTNNSNYIITPYYDLDRQKLPYVDFSSGYIKITNYVIGQGTYLDVNIHQIVQTSDRKLITAIGSNNMLPFGLDGPHPIDMVKQGIDFLESYGGKGTLWVDVKALDNETRLEYIRNLIINNSWELGIHYSKELNNLPLEQAYRVMEEEYSYVYEMIGQKPTTWCSLRNNDNLTHAIYAYDNFGMVWRNGDAGVSAEGSVGNLDDETWICWESVSNAGMIYPVFTHRTDENPSIKYSISYQKFQTWVNNYYSNNVSIISFYEYWQINSNSYHAYFDNIEYNDDILTFDANTNGAKALINVNVNAENDTKVYDNTSRRILRYKVEHDKSITFYVINEHSYKIYIYKSTL